MTYFGFLLRFLCIPIGVLSVLLLRDWIQGRWLPPHLHRAPAWIALLLHVALAVLYTTPWDNYLVATGVWYYDPAKVSGLTIGWVPVEEYTFFVLQTILTGIWLIWLAIHLPPVTRAIPRQTSLRWISAGTLSLVWLGAVAVHLIDWQPGTYLALELGWMLPPIILQLLVGADFLWHQRRLVSLGLVLPIAYLALADALAIESGTWSIHPAQSTSILLGGALPVEELIFFTLTNTLIVFGMVLFLGLDRAPLRAWIRGLRTR